MKYDFIVIGGTGQQGRICARDLLESGYKVMIAGRDQSHIKNLLKNKRACFVKVNLQEIGQIVEVIKKSNADVVVNCAELIWNINVMNACLRTGKSCTDLGGLQKITLEQFKLDSNFKKAGIINITGCGATPGIINIMAAYVAREFDVIDTIELGFAWDSNIKKFVVPYSIKSIFNEFTEPPVILNDGKLVKSDRMVCKGTLNFEEVGRQTTYCIVHSEVYTFYKYFKDKGLKNVHYLAGFPDHSMKTIMDLIELGFNSKEDVKINDIKIKPADFTTEVMKRLKMPEGYKEVENLWINVDGIKKGGGKKDNMRCIVKTIRDWEEAGSNVDTGRTISIISQMLKNKLIKEVGVYGPEAVVPQKIFFKELAKRGMHIYHNGRKIN